MVSLTGRVKSEMREIGTLILWRFIKPQMDRMDRIVVERDLEIQENPLHPVYPRVSNSCEGHRSVLRVLHDRV